MLTLVKKAMRGDKEAFIALMDKHSDAMLRIAHGYLSQEADIADAMQDTILDAYEHLSSLKEPRYFKTWLIRILLNNCNHIYNKTKNYIPLEEISESFSDDAQEIDSPLFRFRELLNCVSDENRLCFQLYYGEELTTREIADILHIKESTIRSRMHREKLRLKSQLPKNGYMVSARKGEYRDSDLYEILHFTPEVTPEIESSMNDAYTQIRKGPGLNNEYRARKGMDMTKHKNTKAHKRNRKYLYLGLAAALLLAFGFWGFSNPVLAGKIPFIGRIFRMVEQDIGYSGNYSDNGKRRYHYDFRSQLFGFGAVLFRRNRL